MMSIKMTDFLSRHPILHIVLSCSPSYYIGKTRVFSILISSQHGVPIFFVKLFWCTLKVSLLVSRILFFSTQSSAGSQNSNNVLLSFNYELWLLIDPSLSRVQNRDGLKRKKHCERKKSKNQAPLSDQKCLFYSNNRLFNEIMKKK